MKILAARPRTALGVLLALLLSLFSVGDVYAVPVIGQVLITNVSGTAFNVSWTTDADSNGSVVWGKTIPPTNTTTDGLSDTTTHYVTIIGLKPNTLYYFKVLSDTSVDDKGGSYYQVTTGPDIIPSHVSQNIDGHVYKSGGTLLAPYATVYLQMQYLSGSGTPGASQLISARADEYGYWSYNLTNLRTSDFSSFFTFTPGGDTIRIFAEGGSLGSSGNVDIFTPAVYPIVQDLTLSLGPTAANLNYFRSTKTDAGIQLSWETVSEASTAGFNLYRREIAGDFVQINDTLIPPQYAGQPLGAAYTYLDTTADPGLRYEYKLEIIEPGLSVIDDALLSYWPFSVSLPLIQN